jgi:hypothetical protein
LNTAVKVGLIAAGTGFAFWAGSKLLEAQKFAQNVTFRLTDFGIPRISGNIMSVPVKVEITNPTDVAINVESVDVIVSLFKENKFVRVGHANITNVPTAPGVNDKVFTAQFDLKAITSNLFDTIAEILTSKQVTIRADVQIVAEGAGLPLQSITKSISIV